MLADQLLTALKIFGPLLLVAGIGAFIYARYLEPKRFRLETVKVTVGGGTNRVEGQAEKPLRILHISDLHLCYPDADKQQFLQAITTEQYDLIFLTGDIFENFSGLCYANSLITCPPRLGAYAVLGNHDYYNYTWVHKTMGKLWKRLRHPAARRDVTPMIKALESGGFKVLRHEAVSLAGQGLHIVGIDYPYLDRAELKQLVSQAPEGHLKLVLFHVPVCLDYIIESGAHIAFGGHTHGGQVRLPGWGAIITDSELPRQEASGLFWRGSTAFHISRGLGADPRSNIRFLCPPAATVVEVSTFKGAVPNHDPAKLL